MLQNDLLLFVMTQKKKQKVMQTCAVFLCALLLVAGIVRILEGNIYFTKLIGLNEGAETYQQLYLRDSVHE